MALKKMVNNRKRHMAGKLVNMKKGETLELTGGRSGVLDGFTSSGFPMVKVGVKLEPIFWEEIKYT
jgi:hypothetical protein